MLVIIVTYQPDIPLLERILLSVNKQSSDVLIVDNASSSLLQTAIKQLTKRYILSALWMEKNVGVASAQNKGILWAKNKRYRHVLFLDQDSIPHHDMILKLRQYYEMLSGKNKVAVVGALAIDMRDHSKGYFVHFEKGQVVRHYCDGRHGYYSCDFLISSGMFMAISTLEEIGFFEEDLFIDNIDLEWCFRAKAHGYGIYGICDAHMQHCLGEKVYKLWLGKWLRFYVHSPKRLYYSTRNRIALYFRAYTPRSWIIQDIPRMLFRFIIFMLLIAPRKEYIKMMVKGVWDGIKYPRCVLQDVKKL